MNEDKKTLFQDFFEWMKEIFTNMKTWFVDQYHILFKSAADNHLRIQKCADGSYQCNIRFASYTDLKKYQRKMRRLTVSLSSAVAMVIVAFIVAPYVMNPNRSAASNYSWTQTAWDAAANASATIMHPATGTTWATKDAGIAFVNESSVTFGAECTEVSPCYWPTGSDVAASATFEVQGGGGGGGGDTGPTNACAGGDGDNGIDSNLSFNSSTILNTAGGVGGVGGDCESSGAGGAGGVVLNPGNLTVITSTNGSSGIAGGAGGSPNGGAGGGNGGGGGGGAYFKGTKSATFDSAHQVTIIVGAGGNGGGGGDDGENGSGPSGSDGGSGSVTIIWNGTGSATNVSLTLPPPGTTGDASGYSSAPSGTYLNGSGIVLQSVLDGPCTQTSNCKNSTTQQCSGGFCKLNNGQTCSSSSSCVSGFCYGTCIVVTWSGAGTQYTGSMGSRIWSDANALCTAIGGRLPNNAGELTTVLGGSATGWTREVCAANAHTTIAAPFAGSTCGADSFARNTTCFKP